MANRDSNKMTGSDIRKRERGKLPSIYVSASKGNFTRVPDSDYAVSKKGRVIRWDRSSIEPKLDRKGSPKILKPFGANLPRVSFSSDGIKEDHLIAELVLTVFDGPPNKGQVIHYHDRDPGNVRFSNLAFMDPEDAERIPPKLGKPTKSQRTALKYLLRSKIQSEEIAAALRLPVPDVKRARARRIKRLKKSKQKPDNAASHPASRKQ